MLSSFHGHIGTVSPSSPGPRSPGVGTQLGLSRPCRRWRPGHVAELRVVPVRPPWPLRVDSATSLSYAQPWGALWNLRPEFGSRGVAGRIAGVGAVCGGLCRR